MDRSKLNPRTRRGLSQPLSIAVSFGVFLGLSLLSDRHAWAALDSLGAIPRAQTEVGIDQIQPQISGEQTPGPSYLRGTLNVEASGYLYSPRTKSEDIYSTLSGKPEYHFEDGILELGGQGEGILLTPLSKKDQPHGFFELPESYFAVGSEGQVGPRVILGRHLEDWNHLDEQWKLGIWQPRYRWDYLRPDSVALTGLSIDVREPLVRVVAFGSPIFIPERGIPISNDNGQLISDSPWFISPPTRISVLSRDTPLRYDLQVPSMRDILFHPSFSGMLRIGDTHGPWISTAYAYKPMNQLLLAYDGHLVINANRQEQDVAVVPVVPRVIYHHLVSFEGGFNQDLFSVWVSSLIDRPGKEETARLDGTFTNQTVTKSFAISPTGEFHTRDEHGNSMKANLSYLYQVGGNGADQSASGPALLAGQSVFEARYPFQDAIKIGGEVELPGLLRSIGIHADGLTAFSSSLLYDIENRGSILTADATYRPSARWQFGVGMDVLGSQDPKPDSQGSSNDFIGRYQANDRVRCGVSYVF